VRNKADSLAYSTEKSLKDLGDKVPAGTKTELEAKVKELRDALAGTDVAAITAATEVLLTASHKMAEEAYKAAGAPGAAGPGPDGGGGAAGAGPAPEPKKEDVVDAEFEEQK